LDDDVSIDILKYLISKGADVNYPVFISGGTTLHDRNPYEVILELLRAGAQVDKANDEGITPLASEISSWESADDIDDTRVICLLMEHGARVENVKLSYIPKWIHEHQRDIDNARSDCAAAAHALFWAATRARGAPKDMARWWVRNYVMASWVEWIDPCMCSDDYDE
jgi:ankyrin repeat protein